MSFRGWPSVIVEGNLRHGGGNVLRPGVVKVHFALSIFFVFFLEFLVEL